MSSDLAIMNMVNGFRNMVDSRIQTPNDLIFGEVVSVDPLRIDIGNNQVLGEKFLFLGQMCRPYNVKIPHTHKYNGETENEKTGISATTTATISSSPTPGVITITDNGHKHEIKNQETDDVHQEHDVGKETGYEDYVTIEIEPKLQIGDKVLMFAFNNHQMYYVAERII